MASVDQKLRNDAYKYQPQGDIVCVWENCNDDSNPELGAPLCMEHAKKLAVQVMLLNNRVMPTSKAIKPAKTLPKPPKRNPNRGTGLIYFIQFSDRIKIGFTTNLPSRMSAVPNDKILALLPGTVTTEAILHKKFDHLRITGEWFSMGEELLDYIAAVPEHPVLAA